MQCLMIRGPNAVLKNNKNGNFKVTFRFLRGEKKTFPPQRRYGNNKKSVVAKVQILGHTHWEDVGYRRIIRPTCGKPGLPQVSPPLQP